MSHDPVPTKKSVLKSILISGLILATLPAILFISFFFEYFVSNGVDTTDYSFSEPVLRHRLSLHTVSISSSGKYLANVTSPDSSKTTLAFYDVNTLEPIGQSTLLNPNPKQCIIGSSVEWREDQAVLSIIRGSDAPKSACPEHLSYYALSPDNTEPVKVSPPKPDAYNSYYSRETPKLARCTTHGLCFEKISSTVKRVLDPDLTYLGVKLIKQGKSKTIGWREWSGQIIGFNKQGDLLIDGAGEGASFLILNHQKLESLL